MPATTTLYAPYGLPHTALTPNWLANVLVAAIFTPLGALVIALRLIATCRRHRPKALDDLFMLLAYIASLGFTITSILSLRWGVGLKADEVPAGWAKEAMRVTYGVEIFYYCSIFLVKVSILCVYLRITQGVAGDGRGKEWWLRRGTWCTLALLTLHFVSTLVVAAVQCTPLSLFWTSRTSVHHSSVSTTIPTTSFSHQTDARHGHCINITAFFYSTNAFTILTDLIILILPLRVFWKLNMPRKQKWSVIGAFAVGGVSTIASCVRLYSVRMFMSTARGLEDAAPINTWSFVEINLGILCASVPAIKPLIFPTRTRTASTGAINDSAPTLPNPRPRHRGSTSKLFASLLSGFTHRDTSDDDRTQDDGIALDTVPEQSRKEKMQKQKGGGQRLSQLGLRSAVMTSSRGSLRNYRASAEGGGRRTTGSSESTMAGRLETEAKEGV